MAKKTFSAQQLHLLRLLHQSLHSVATFVSCHIYFSFHCFFSSVSRPALWAILFNFNVHVWERRFQFVEAFRERVCLLRF